MILQTIGKALRMRLTVCFMLALAAIMMVPSDAYAAKKKKQRESPLCLDRC